MMTVLVILLLLTFISGAPLFTIMLATAALGAVFSTGGFEASFETGAIGKMFGIHSRDEIEVLSTIPLFIYAGYMLAEAKTADRLVRFANAMLGWLPGGLAIVTIMTCALFTVFTGASGVTIIALGGVLMPALVRNGYPERFSMGLIAGTGSVGLLFPPALPLFIYGTVYGLTNLDPENWDTRRFLFAGIVPGMVLIGMLSAVAVFVAIRKKLPTQKFQMGELAKSFAVALPELFIPFGVILGLAKGFGLNEIAALTVVYVFILEVGIFRTLKLKALWAISFEGMAMIGAIFAIIFASTALTDFMVAAEVPKKLVTWTQNHVESKIVFLLAINLILLIVGTIMDIFSAIVVVLPLIAPIAKAYGIDPYHLGVIFLLNLEVGYLHPPVGLNLFLTSVKFNRPITEVMWATVPFLITMIVALLVITYVPKLTVVPEAERTAPIANLVEIVRSGIDESRVAITELTFVDAAGRPVVDVEGKSTTRKFADCTKKLEIKQDPNSKAPAKVESDDEYKKRVASCQDPFIAVTKCLADKACANKAIAEWIVRDVNGDLIHQERAIVVVNEIKLVDEAGEPLLMKAPVLDAKGQPTFEMNEVLGDDAKPVMGPDGKPKLEPGAQIYEDKPLVDKDGKPVVKHLEACAAYPISSEIESCRAPFVLVSNCAIDFDVAECAESAAEECKAGETAPAPTEGAGSGSATAGSGSATAEVATGSAGTGSAGSAAPAGDGSADATGSGSGSAGTAGDAASGSGSAGTTAGSDAASGSAGTTAGSAGTTAGSSDGSAGTGSATAGSGTTTGSAADGSAGSAGSGSGSGTAAAGGTCESKAIAACADKKIAECRVEKLTEWVGEKDNTRYLQDPPNAPKKAANDNAGAAASSSEGGGCSATGGGLSALLIVASALVLRRRWKRAASAA